MMTAALVEISFRKLLELTISACILLIYNVYDLSCGIASIKLMQRKLGKESSSVTKPELHLLHIEQ